MSAATVSEQLFEQFCVANSLPFRRLPAGQTPTPDYELELGGATVRVEIEQIESKAGINPFGVSTRTVGKHLRKKITDARRQAKASSNDGYPTILLVYNLVDEPFQSFGTEPHDFIAAMYGEFTVRLVDGKATDSYNGKNAKFRRDAYTYFSAVGHLRRTSGAPEVVLYENAFAERALSWNHLPSCIQVQRVEVPDAA